MQILTNMKQPASVFADKSKQFPSYTWGVRWVEPLSLSHGIGAANPLLGGKN